jgi:polyribonucleotide nucleotidyltransferase
LSETMTVTKPSALGITSLETDAFYPDMKRGSLTIAGQTIYVETGRLARSAAASVLVQLGETVVFVACSSSDKPRDGIDFFPLLVDFEEKMYSVGRLPGGYLKREGKPSDKAVLSSRLIDRPIRPLFPDGYRNDVQITASCLAMDSVNPPDVLAIFAASTALTLAKKVPFLGPLGAVRIGYVDNQFVVNPTFKQLENSDLDLVVSGTADSIMMVEAGANFVGEDLMIQALELAHEEIKVQVAFQEALAKELGVVKTAFVPEVTNEPLVQWLKGCCESAIDAAFHIADKEERSAKLDATKTEAKEALTALGETHELNVLLGKLPGSPFGEAFKAVEKKVMRRMVAAEGVRADGRGVRDIRPIKTHVSILPRVHGSALFTRGSTQAISICTLGAPGDAQKLDGVDPATEKRYMHHYSFPAYSVGEVRPNRGPGRREIGHGALAERAVLPSLPSKEDFPYALRVNSEIVESNGSTSMASTCGSTLALMDAGVPIKHPVGGIAMGLIKEGEQTIILSDILGVEDFLGDMDFKVTGSREGITALQMDIKIQGISVGLMKDALAQAKEGRLHILGKMAEAISESRPELSEYAPRILTLKIDTDQIGAVIGPGGKMIRSIIEETGATIDISDDGTVLITSVQGIGGEKAREIIENLTRKIEPGTWYVGKVLNMIPIGAFVQLSPGKEGMIHISQFPKRVPSVDAAVASGDDVLVRVVDVDDRGRISLTMKDVTNEMRAEYGLEAKDLYDPSVDSFPGFDPNSMGGGRGERGGDRPFRGGGGRGGDRPFRGGGGGGGDRPRRPRYED